MVERLGAGAPESAQRTFMERCHARAAERQREAAEQERADRARRAEERRVQVGNALQVTGAAFKGARDAAPKRTTCTKFGNNITCTTDP